MRTYKFTPVSTGDSGLPTSRIVRDGDWIGEIVENDGLWLAMERSECVATGKTLEAATKRYLACARQEDAEQAAYIAQRAQESEDEGQRRPASQDEPLTAEERAIQAQIDAELAAERGPIPYDPEAQEDLALHDFLHPDGYGR